MDVMQPQFADEQPVNPYDFWEGADFKIKIRKVEGWVNYDKSEFASVSQLHGGDETRLQETYDKIHSLTEFTNPDNYKSYDELKLKLNRVLGVEADGPVAEAPVMNAVEATPQPFAEAPSTAPTQDAKEDDTLSYFAKLAQE
jgi:hypothetical protein